MTEPEIQPTRPGPLAGIRVVDLTQFVSGPIASMVLGDLGAEVIKVEPPTGEPARHLGKTFTAGWSTFFLAVNRNKRFVSIDYRNNRGRELLRELIRTADVFVENSRPGTWAKHQLDYESLHAINDRLIYASISGFGQTGPMRDWVAMDPVAQAAGGLVGITGSTEGGPAKVGAAIADVMSGRLAAFGIVTALYDRMRTGKGQRIDTSLFSTAIGMLSIRETEYQFTQENPELLGTGHGQIVPAQAYLTADSRRVMLCLYAPAHWIRWAQIAGAEPLLDDPRFVDNMTRCANRDAANEAVQDVMGRRTEAEWTELLAGEVPYGPVMEFDQLWSHDQLSANDLIMTYDMPDVGEVRTVGSPVQFSGFRPEVSRIPRPIGADTVEVLQAAGFTDVVIADLLAQGVVHVDTSDFPSLD
jgi:crotonobetainyl-CoA:carnitine CoA-transferase CaiB-like acyl-CoA transferase